MFANWRICTLRQQPKLSQCNHEGIAAILNCHLMVAFRRTGESRFYLGRIGLAVLILA